ncbi:Oxysterol-binding isoform B [Sphaceloma murrayae]|uniref:Oxysterol-binding isoform B n=1 Tax=Sphaceloma murrayae TaxID=2082308 RepID=A0A2K1QSR7_9PEZI|nr:Oxysterol-binding isoform B [Sphaceloma murrayae]
MSRTATMTLPQHAHAGVKRPADDSLDDEQRFAKRFNLLNIVDNPSKLYIPVPSHNGYQPSPLAPSAVGPPETTDPDTMPVDDTAHRVFIHDLDAELASESDSGPSLVFLPDIEKHLTRIPHRLLRPDSRDGQGKELVLYDTGGAQGSEEQDLVRRAMEETRRRKREEWERRTRQTFDKEGVTETAHGFGGEEWAGRGERDEKAEARAMGWGEIVDRMEGDEGVQEAEEQDVDAMDIG